MKTICVTYKSSGLMLQQTTVTQVFILADQKLWNTLNDP